MGLSFCCHCNTIARAFNSKVKAEIFFDWFQGAVVAAVSSERWATFGDSLASFSQDLDSWNDSDITSCGKKKLVEKYSLMPV